MNTTYQPGRLYAACCIALLVVGLTFSIRADILEALRSSFALSNEQLGWMAGAAFWGYTAGVFIGGPLCDVLGMGRLLLGACGIHILALIANITAGGFWQLWAATLAIGIGNALLEASINPLVATLYPHEKSSRLNRVHAWFPWGIVGGGLACYALSQLAVGWQWKVALMFPFVIVYGALCFGQAFPRTERVEQGVSTRAMFADTLRPAFLLWLFCMFLTASTELGPNQWIPTILTTTASMPGILVLVWINSIMAVGRMLAGPVVHRLSSVGLLTGAVALSAVGLYALSYAQSTYSALAAATVFALGVCYLWPTMLGVTAERFPSGGPWALAVISGAGNLSVALVLPAMGRIYDQFGPAMALRWVVVLPAILFVIFGLVLYRDRHAADTPRLFSTSPLD